VDITFLQMKPTSEYQNGYEYLRFRGVAKISRGSVETSVKLSPEASDKIAEIVLSDARKQLREALKD
jgi:hypothetical protein